MMFQDFAVTTGPESKIFTSFYRQKFVFESCFGTGAKKLISLLFFGCLFCFFGFALFAKQVKQ